jgi:gluconate 2-dehydrogenase gamma chain
MMQSRRDWIFGCLATIARQEIASAQQHAHEAAKAGASARLEVLDANSAAEIAALASEIVPSDDGPGAAEAGVMYFIDRALATFASGTRENYRKGLAAVQEKRRSLFPDSTSIASLPRAQRLELMRAIESSEFFELLRIHTLLGFLGDPGYGGNRGKVGWKHIGFEDSMAFQPPFGHYDAEALKGAKE